jgi:hypothetical protein
MPAQENPMPSPLVIRMQLRTTTNASARKLGVEPTTQVNFVPGSKADLGLLRACESESARGLVC